MKTTLTAIKPGIHVPLVSIYPRIPRSARDVSAEFDKLAFFTLIVPSPESFFGNHLKADGAANKMITRRDGGQLVAKDNIQRTPAELALLASEARTPRNP